MSWKQLCFCFVFVFVYSHNVCDTADPELSDQPPFCNRKINAAKDFRKVLIFMHDSVPCANGFWSRKFGLEIDEHTIMVNIIISNERKKALLCAASLPLVLIALPALGRSWPGLKNPTMTRMGFEPKAFRPVIRCGNHYATRGLFFFFFFSLFFFLLLLFTVVAVVVLLLVFVVVFQTYCQSTRIQRSLCLQNGCFLLKIQVLWLWTWTKEISQAHAILWGCAFNNLNFQIFFWFLLFF